MNQWVLLALLVGFWVFDWANERRVALKIEAILLLSEKVLLKNESCKSLESFYRGCFRLGFLSV